MKFLLRMIFVFFFIGLASCKDSRNSQPTVPAAGPAVGATGGSDVGGGNTDQSTVEQVKAAIQNSVRLMQDLRWKKYNDSKIITIGQFQEMKEEDIESNKLYRLMDYLLNPRQAYFDQNADDSVCGSSIADCDLLTLPSNKKLYQEAQELPDYTYLDKIFNSITYVTEGFCPADDKDNADASVTSYTLEATLCFSLDSLKRIPPADIEKNVLGLWIHELAHMHGHREEMAKTLQEMAMEAYAFLASDHVDPIAAVSNAKIREIKVSVVEMKAHLIAFHAHMVNEEGDVTDHPHGMESFKMAFTTMGKVKAQALDLLKTMVTYPSAVKCLPFVWVAGYDPFYSVDPHSSFEANLERLIHDVDYYIENLSPNMPDFDHEDPELSQFEFVNIFDFNRCREAEEPWAVLEQ